MFALGYCFGGKYVLRLAATAEITAGAVAHGTQVTYQDIAGVVRPVSFVCVEEDGLFPDETREAGKKYLEDNNIEHEMKVFSGVPHGEFFLPIILLVEAMPTMGANLCIEGFAVMGSYEDSKIQRAQKEANIQMLEWLISHET